MQLPAEIQEAILVHAEWEFPREACGLIAADDEGALRMAYCLTNMARGTNRFTLDPIEHFGALRHAERVGWRIVGSFHSHPHSVPVPSETDVAGALDPEWLYFIVGPVARGPVVRAFRIIGGKVDEVEVTP